LYSRLYGTQPIAADAVVLDLVNQESIAIRELTVGAGPKWTTRRSSLNQQKVQPHLPSKCMTQNCARCNADFFAWAFGGAASRRKEHDENNDAFLVINIYLNSALPVRYR
jgi:hypothetical protein